MGVMSKLPARKLTHTRNMRQKAVIQPPLWNKETPAALTDKSEMVKLWQKDRYKPHPHLTVKAQREEKSQLLKRVSQQNKRQAAEKFL